MQTPEGSERLEIFENGASALFTDSVLICFYQRRPRW